MRVFAIFCEGGASPRPRKKSQILQKQYYIKNIKQTFLPCFCVRDSSEKPAMSEANEDLQRIARPERSEGHALNIPIMHNISE